MRQDTRVTVSAGTGSITARDHHTIAKLCCYTRGNTDPRHGWPYRHVVWMQCLFRPLKPTNGSLKTTMDPFLLIRVLPV